MKRRELLKQLGFGLGAGVVLPSLWTACTKDDPGPEVPYDGRVAVIGGGAAGLYAADILRAKGIDVILFEASGQLGGRVRSLRNQRNAQGFPIESTADFPVELGAEIIYGSNSIWSNIIKNLNIPQIDLTTTTDVFALGAEVKSAAEWGADPDFVAVSNFIAALPGFSGGPVSVQQAASLSARAENLLNALGGNLYGSSADRLGATGLGESLAAISHDDKKLLIRSNPMQDVVLSRFNRVASRAQLNTAIKSIQYGGNVIVLRDQAGNEVEVNKVIVTVPLAVLKSGGITFSPALPALHTSALSRMGMDACVRLILDFKKNFWGLNAGTLWGGSVVPQYLNTGVGRSQFSQTLTATVTGAKAEALSALGAAAINPVLAELDALYNGQGTEFVRRDLNTNEVIFFLQDWTKDEFIKGGYSYLLPNGTLADREALATPIQDKLYFAGEATDITGSAGTITGALASSERVAQQVVESILAG